jgi:hypothetical protein
LMMMRWRRRFRRGKDGDLKRERDRVREKRWTGTGGEWRRARGARLSGSDGTRLIHSVPTAEAPMRETADKLLLRRHSSVHLRVGGSDDTHKVKQLVRRTRGRSPSMFLQGTDTQLHEKIS